jgi:hypothetical protein
MSRKAIGIVLGVVGMVIAVYVYLTYFGERSWQRRVERSSQFFDVGKEVASRIRNSQAIPQSMDDLKVRTGMSEEQWRFFQSNKVTYLPPKVLSNAEVGLTRPDGHLGEAVRMVVV